MGVCHCSCPLRWQGPGERAGGCWVSQVKPHACVLQAMGQGWEQRGIHLVHLDMP